MSERTANPRTPDGSGFLTTELIFTVVGGFLDAYSYLAHGHVFVNAQTGNVVMLAVYAASGDWNQTLRRIPPIAAWIAGIVGALLIGVRPGRTAYVASLFCKAVEVVALFLLAAYGSLIQDPWIVPMLSFVAAFQLASFAVPGTVTFTSTMVTGNLRNGLTALVLALRGEDKATNRRRAIVEGIACSTFLLGALLGGVVTLRYREHALFAAAVIAALGLVVGWKSFQRVGLR